MTNSAVCSHIGLRMIAFTTSASQLCEKHVLSGGWSESSNLGVTQVTGGNRFALMSSTSASTERVCSWNMSEWNTGPIPFSAFQKYPLWPGWAA